MASSNKKDNSKQQQKRYSASSNNATKTSSKKDNELVAIMLHTKDTITKDNKDKRKEPAKNSRTSLHKFLIYFVKHIQKLEMKNLL